MKANINKSGQTKKPITVPLSYLCSLRNNTPKFPCLPAVITAKFN